MATSEMRFIPCKIGDEVWTIRKYNGVRLVRKGKVSQMYFIEGMKLAIIVKGLGGGDWGKSVFATEEEAKRSIEGAEK